MFGAFRNVNKVSFDHASTARRVDGLGDADQNLEVASSEIETVCKDFLVLDGLNVSIVSSCLYIESVQ